MPYRILQYRAHVATLHASTTDDALLREQPIVPPRRHSDDDIGFWPRSQGGQGFRHPKDTAPSRQFSALRTRDKHGNLVADDSVTPQTVTSIVANTRDYTPDTVRSRARATLVLAIERAQRVIADEANELTLNELAPTMAALGRISGVQADDKPDGVVTIRIVRDQLTAMPVTRLLPPVYNEVAGPPTHDATASTPSGYVTDDEYAERVEAMARPLGDA